VIGAAGFPPIPGGFYQTKDRERDDRDRNEAEAEVNLMPKPHCPSIGDAMAANAASYVLMVPPEHRDDATASAAEGFRDACIDTADRSSRAI
jgi:hypothetical protein